MELEGLSLIDLRNLAKDKGIQNTSKLKKSELIEKIMENYNCTETTDKKSEKEENEEKIENVNNNNDAEYKLTSENDEYVEGIYDSGINEKEAESIVSEVIRRFNDKALCTKTIGIVTFNMKQQELILNMINDLFDSNPKFNEINETSPKSC